MDMILQDRARAHPNAAAVAAGQTATTRTTGSTRAADAAKARAGEYLTFRLGAEAYAIDILTVQEIRSYEAPTRIANAPPFVMGVTNLRGVIVPILDLRLKLGCAQATYDAFTVVIVLNVGGRVVGAVVDTVSDVMALGDDQIRPAPALARQADEVCITGMATVGSDDERRMLILLDIARLMAAAGLG